MEERKKTYRGWIKLERDSDGVSLIKERPRRKYLKKRNTNIYEIREFRLKCNVKKASKSIIIK